MDRGRAIVDELKKAGISHVAWLPDSDTHFLQQAITSDPEIDVVQVCKEGEAVGICFGLHLAGKRSAMLIKNLGMFESGDVRVRKAMSLAINRQEMADNLYAGFAKPLFLWNVPETAFYADPNLMKPDPYDPEGAKKLIAEAGHATGFSTKIFDRGMGVTADNAYNQAIAGYWRKIGVSAEVVPMDYTILRGMWKPKHKPEIWGNASGTISNGGMFQFEKMNSGYHSTISEAKNINIPRLDELIIKIPNVTDPAEKNRLAQEAAMLASNEHATLGILAHDTIYALGPKIGTLVPTKGLSHFGSALASMTHAK